MAKDDDLKGSFDKDNHMSFVARLGAKLDPLNYILGEKYHAPGIKLADWSNKAASSIVKHDPGMRFDRKYGFSRKGSPIRQVSTWTKNKPVDTAAIVVGSIFGGGALAGAMGGGAGGTGGGAAAGGGTASASSAGGAAAGGGSAAGSAAPTSGMSVPDWIKLGQAAAGSMRGGQQQQVMQPQMADTQAELPPVDNTRPASLVQQIGVVPTNEY